MDDSKRYVSGIDIGGTFTDCTLVDQDGQVYIGKVPSTPGDNFQTGFFDSVEEAGRKADEDPSELYDKITRITHGTTIATNAILEDEGDRVSLLTTKGHEDTIRMMRGLGRATGEPPENILKVAEIPKPEPLVEKSRIHGVPERVDSEGDIVVDLNESAVRRAVEDFLEKGVEAIAISYLWSFKNDAHERRTREIVREVAGEDLFVSLSSEIAPSVGEYERTTATCINSIVGSLIETYLNELQHTLRSNYGFDGTFLLMGCNGGAFTPNQAVGQPIMLIGSGPVGGLKACQRLGEDEGIPNVLATDMGGTSFELGMVSEGRPLVQEKTILKKYFYDIPKLDVKSIGAGGGSIAKATRGELTVGPESAGSDPGPACYGRGGERPTVTDADLLLGFIDPDVTFGTGTLQPSLDRAETTMESICDELGQTPLEAAAGIFDVANAKMANLIEQEVIGRGYDPRDYHVVSYGGAGPIHASSYARTLDTQSIVVPGDISPVLSAYGILNSNIRQEVEAQIVELEPFDIDRLDDAFANLEEQGYEALMGEHIEADSIHFERYALMRFEGQYHELEIPVPNGTIDEEARERIVERFKSSYGDRYSAAAVFPEARVEIVSLRLEPVGEVEQFPRAVVEETSESVPANAQLDTREIYWPNQNEMIETPIYDGGAVLPGNSIKGPTVIDLSNTSIVVYDDQTVEKNIYSDFVITNEVA